MHKILFAIGLVVAGCQGDDVPPPPDMSGPPNTGCEQSGGTLISGGLGQLVCQYPAKDAGKTCNSSSECGGHCMADGRICTPVTPYFGCFETYENGATPTICVD